MSKLLWPKSSYILITIYFFNEYAFNECACILFAYHKIKLYFKTRFLILYKE